MSLPPDPCKQDITSYLQFPCPSHRAMEGEGGGLLEDFKGVTIKVLSVINTECNPTLHLIQGLPGVISSENQGTGRTAEGCGQREA